MSVLDINNNEIDLKQDFEEENEIGLSIQKDVLGPDVMTDDDDEGYEIGDIDSEDDGMLDDDEDEFSEPEDDNSADNSDDYLFE